MHGRAASGTHNTKKLIKYSVTCNRSSYWLEFYIATKFVDLDDNYMLQSGFLSSSILSVNVSLS